MRGSVTGKVVEWEAGETMGKMTDQFGPADYSTFGALLVVSTIIGCYFGWVDRKNKDDTNYALGGQAFSALPVALSLTATSLSAITMMGESLSLFNGNVFWRPVVSRKPQTLTSLI